MSLTKNNYIRFWIIQIGTVFFVLLFCTLALWQLDRGDIKSEIEAASNNSNNSYEAIRLPVTDLEQSRYKKIKLYGKYDNNKQFLLDNQVRNRVVGYNVLTPFNVVQENKWVMVDRGWIPQAIGRQTFPDIGFNSKDLQISGSIYVPYDKAYSLGGIADGEDDGWPRRIQYIDYQQIGERLGISIEPFTVRLAVDQAHGYDRNWQAAILTSNKHYGYAFQWFAMAGAVIVLWWVYSIKPLRK